MALFNLIVRGNYDQLERRLDKIESHLHFIIKQNTYMAKKIDEINEQLDEINNATNNIAADLDRLASQTDGGLSAEEAESVTSRLRESATALRAVANRNPEEPTEPEPTE